MKIKTGSIIGFIGIGLLLGAVRNQQRRNAVVDAVNIIIKNFPGYQILKCNAISILNEGQAIKYAFDSGKLASNIDNMWNKLFSSENCFTTLDYNETTAKFTYNLIGAFVAGQVQTNKLTLENGVKLLDSLRSDFKNNGFNIDNWINDSKVHILLVIQKYK